MMNYGYGMMQNLWMWGWFGPFVQVLVFFVLVLLVVKLYQDITKKK
ncbi:MAG TPA: hypothetical protein VJL09_03840 [Candidatus Paceibacterota bacterium]